MSEELEIQREYEAFLDDVIKSEEVWILKNDEGLACQKSIEYEGMMSILLWSNAILAEGEREGEFANLQAEPVALYDFLFNWLDNMHQEGVICGLNWHHELGLEVEPAHLSEHLKAVLPEDTQETYRRRLASETC